MGYKTEFNWVLKLKKEQGLPENLKEGATCQFQKRETRIYPIKIPIFLADSSWNVCASVIIKEFTVKDDTTSGGVREHRYKERAANIKEKGINPKDFDHLRFFKYGMPPHGGLAMGIERITQTILGLENVREASLTPRDPDRLTP